VPYRRMTVGAPDSGLRRHVVVVMVLLAAVAVMMVMMRLLAAVTVVVRRLGVVVVVVLLAALAVMVMMMRLLATIVGVGVGHPGFSFGRFRRQGTEPTDHREWFSFLLLDSRVVPCL
ncbi:MAG: hypothetical protein J4F99_05355, partial [Acidimicrobiia bacterium]|nr:hypothetical protein [Acidimicrobiia bacterium]